MLEQFHITVYSIKQMLQIYKKHTAAFADFFSMRQNKMDVMTSFQLFSDLDSIFFTRKFEVNQYRTDNRYQL